MKKTMLWLPFIALIVAPQSHAMLGAQSSDSKKSQKSSVSSTKRTAPKPRTRELPDAAKNPIPPEMSEQDMSNVAKELSAYSGMSETEIKGFLLQTQGMSPDELQSYVSGLQQNLQEGNIQPSDVDTSMPKNFKPKTKVPGKRKQGMSIREQQNKQAFEGLMNDVLPLSPDQIKKLHKTYDMSLQAKATPPNAPPTPHFSSMPVHLEPGSQSPVIRLSAGFVSTLLFVDRTGAPWPIAAYSLGNPQDFNIQWDNSSNTMFVQSNKRYTHANMAIRLVGLNTPVMLTLVSGQKDVDFRVDLQLQSRGPEAFPAVVEKTPYSSKVNSEMINMLDGIPPQGSIKLDVHGDYAQAWLYNNKVYYRSKITLLSPAWMATVSSPDGTHVYEIMPTPYILASHNGKTVNIKLTGL